MPHAQPLSPRFDRLRDRLAGLEAGPGDDDTSLGWAAVALVLVPSPDALLLIRRAVRAGDPRSGHMALPGGRRSPRDEDLVATAIRETAEEVGLTLARSDLLGRLEDLVPRIPTLPPVAVRPYVFTLAERPALTLNDEVAASRWVYLDHLLHPDTYHSVRMDIRGEGRDVPAYRLEEAIVWGMTERILTGFLQHVRP
jgi:8-oxo-dGTP pyrophosphatase MutT (NUDIX family)